VEDERIDRQTPSVITGMYFSLPPHSPSLLSQITHPRPWRIVDLGCGSGLCGRLFCNLNETNESPPEAILCHDSTITLEDALQSPTTAPASSPLLLGIDISSQMVELSRQNGGYSHVYCDDLRSSLTRLSCSIQRNETNPMNLIISADTFLYVGLLGEIFSLIHQCLSVSGIFLFSTEQLENSPMKLARGARGGQDQREGEELRKFEPEGYAVGAQMLSSGRFAHSHSYILALVEMCGFSIVHIEDIIVRTEVSIPLPGKIYVAQKVAI
jgi:predicted TPR repeat methyltransferase